MANKKLIVHYTEEMKTIFHEKVSYDLCYIMEASQMTTILLFICPSIHTHLNYGSLVCLNQVGQEGNAVRVDDGLTVVLRILASLEGNYGSILTLGSFDMTSIQGSAQRWM